MKTIFLLLTLTPSAFLIKNLIPNPSIQEVIEYPINFYRLDDYNMTQLTFWITDSTSLNILTKPKQPQISMLQKNIDNLKSKNIKDFKTKQTKIESLKKNIEKME